jgi:SAM-dependent methyltransferase
MGSADATECPCCACTDVRVFFSLEKVPVNSVLLLSTREEALAFPTGDILLGHCSTCGFVYNTAFDAARLEYSTRYEETQGYSPTFRRWHEELADRVVERYGLRGKEIIEIGCGKGEFLRLLCEAGDNRGLGFDPAYVPGREGEGSAEVSFVQDYYGEKHAHHRSDFVCCKMTLEHIARPLEFVQNVRRTIGDDLDTVVFFQVPDLLRILDERAFWDIYYEHCNYFSSGSLARLFRAAGFDVTGLQRDYGDQYILLDARPAPPGSQPSAALAEEEDLDTIAKQIASFEEAIREHLETWDARLSAYREEGKKVVIWGSGSKGVAFLTALPNSTAIEFVVDINPNRHNHFMAKTGQRIVGPEHLEDYQPDIVIIMNRVYHEEIARELRERNIAAETITAD